MIFEDDETLRMYVEESLEHLSDIESDLLAMESQGSDLDDELVNNVFRAAHSIKGGAGFMGLTCIKDLGHSLENILGLIRSQDIVPTPAIISTLLAAFDRLQALLQNVETSNEEDVSTHIHALDSITEGNAEPEVKEQVSEIVCIQNPVGSGVLEASRFDLEQAFKQGKFLFFVEFDLVSDIQKKKKTPLEVITSLYNSGVILDARVDVDSVGKGDAAKTEIPFLVLFASIIEPDMAAVLVDLPADRVHYIAEDELERCITQTRASGVQVVDSDPDLSELGLKSQMPEPAESAFVPMDCEPEAAQPPSEEAEETLPEAPPVAAPAPLAQEDIPVLPETDPLPDSDKAATRKKMQTSLRVNVGLLDTLMTLAGELVLSRNQLMQGVSASSNRATETASQRIDMITSELQEAIMRTRMQPIANVFNKFTRVVRDLAQILGKQVNLVMEGKDVELDKTIIEAINDPLTHLVRNAVDHGIEAPELRERTGKTPVGRVSLKAFHEAGQVNIEIEDDGKGLDPEAIAASAVKKGLISEQDAAAMGEKEKVHLIFLPGFSTAAEVTDVSGRGVGMDVVKTNLDKLGGIIDIESRVGQGSTIRIKLPLTLAIIPSQIISVGKERYAIPQVNLNELLRIPAAQVKDRIERVGDAEVVRLRGTLLPLLNLSEVLDIPRTFIHPETGEELIDRRSSISDRRLDESDGGNPDDRRYHSESAINIAVVSAGTFKYGLVVDDLRDSEEIVVKPLGRHLKDCKGYAGATIMGDGKVALILDVASLAGMANLSSSVTGQADPRTETRTEIVGLTQEQSDKASLLLFQNGEDEHFAVPLNLVERIERIKAADIEFVGGKRVVQYRGGTLPLHELGEVAKVQERIEREQVEVIVFRLAGREVGLLVTPPVDAVEAALNVDDSTLRQIGIMGSVIINGHTTLMVDIFEIFQTLNPEWFENLVMTDKNDSGAYRILFAEDSAFFRNQVAGFLAEGGYEVMSAEDGREAWEILEQDETGFSVIVTDLEMPVMDGFELTQRIKDDPRYRHLPVIALTSLAGEEDMEKGKRCGIDDYQIKLDREKLLLSIQNYISGRA